MIIKYDNKTIKYTNKWISVDSQPTPPSYHDRTFRNCGSNTTTGAAELAQIPSDWK